MTLRQAAKETNIDIVDWSKMERGVNSAPLNHERMGAILKLLNLQLEQGNEVWKLFLDSAFSKAPEITEEAIESCMPIFTRLDDKQIKKLRPLIVESLTRNKKF